jgi:hypothetical protein
MRKGQSEVLKVPGAQNGFLASPSRKLWPLPVSCLTITPPKPVRKWCFRFCTRARSLRWPSRNVGGNASAMTVDPGPLGTRGASTLRCNIEHYSEQTRSGQSGRPMVAISGGVGIPKSVTVASNDASLIRVRTVWDQHPVLATRLSTDGFLWQALPTVEAPRTHAVRPKHTGAGRIEASDGY